MHHWDAKEKNVEKARWKLHKNAMCYSEQILEETTHKTAAVQPLTSHLTNHSNKTNKTCEALLEKSGRTRERRSPTDERTTNSQPERTYIHQRCTDTGCRLDDLPGAIDDRDGYQEKFRELSVVCAIWWFICTAEAVTWLNGNVKWCMQMPT